MLPTSRTHPRLHRRNPQINFLIVTNHRYVLKDSDLFFSQHFKKIVGRFNDNGKTWEWNFFNVSERLRE